MFEAKLIAPNTTVTAKGDGAAIDISAVAGKTLLLTLNIRKVVEQESLDLSIWGSPDGAAWEQKPLAAFPQKFYAGQHPLLLDLSENKDIRFLRAHWEVNRWGRGSETPMFQLDLTAREVPADLLREATAEAHARR
jgi:hypothetical protein